jgi:hypothetical protein
MELPLAAGAVVPASDESNALHATYMTIDGGISFVKYTLFNTADTSDAIHFYIQYTPETGIQNQDARIVTLYPNPATDILHIAGLPQECRYSVYSQTGQKVKEGKIGDVVNVSGLMAGVYVLEMWVGKETVRKKFVIK